MVGEGLDPVGKEDGDVDNDGDEDKTDKYILNRRKAIGKAIAKKKGKKKLKERKSEIIGSLLSEGKKKVNEDMDRFYIQQPDKRYTSSVDKDDPTKIAYTSADTEGARRFSPSQAYTMVQGGKARGDARSMVKADPDAQADFHQHLDDSGVLLAKDHAKHGIKHMELGYDEKTAYDFSSKKHPGLSDPHTFHDVENKGVSAVGFMPKDGLDLDPQKVRAERMMTREHERVIDTHGIEDRDAKSRYKNESVNQTGESLQETVLAGLDRAPKAEVNYAPKTLREATMDRIKKVSNNIKRDETSPIMDRLKGI